MKYITNINFSKKTNAPDAGGMAHAAPIRSPEDVWDEFIDNLEGDYIDAPGMCIRDFIWREDTESLLTQAVLSKGLNELNEICPNFCAKYGYELTVSYMTPNNLLYYNDFIEKVINECHLDFYRDLTEIYNAEDVETLDLSSGTLHIPIVMILNSLVGDQQGVFTDNVFNDFINQDISSHTRVILATSLIHTGKEGNVYQAIINSGNGLGIGDGYLGYEHIVDTFRGRELDELANNLQQYFEDIFPPEANAENVNAEVIGGNELGL